MLPMSTDLPIARVGRYRIVAELGRGGMGVVYRGRDDALGRDVAIKMLSGRAAPASDDLERFVLEARAAAKLRHPGIVAVHEVGTQAGAPFIVLDFVDGESLAELIARGRLPPRRTAELVRQVAAALEHAHGHGVLHRDVKPQNVMVDREGRALLTDFGLARDADDDRRLTLTGEVIGTPSFMAPEQASGDRAGQGPATDVWAIGAVLYHGILGRPPFQGGSALEVLQDVLTADPPAPRSLDPKVHPDLETIALKCLEKDSARRYGSAGEVAAELGRFLEGEAIRARPPTRLERWKRRLARRPAVVAASLLGVVVVLGGPAGWVLSTRAARQPFVAAARKDFFDASSELERTRGRSLGGARRGDGRLLVLALGAHEAARRWRVTADAAGVPTTEAEAAIAKASEELGVVARETYQWSMASEALEQTADDGDAASREALDAIRIDKRARRVWVLGTLDEAANPGSFDQERQVALIVRYAAEDTVGLLAERLEAMTTELNAVTKRVLMEVARPSRPGEEPIAGVEGAIDDWFARELGEGSREEIANPLRAVDARLKARDEADGFPFRRDTRDLVAAAQEQELLHRFRVARLCCDALGRIGIRERALPALLDYFRAVVSERHAVPPARALALLGGPEALIAILDQQHVHGFGLDSTFWRALTGYLDPATPEGNERFGNDQLEHGLARSLLGDLEGAEAELTEASERSPEDFEPVWRRGLVRLALGEPAEAVADLTEAHRLHRAKTGKSSVPILEACAEARLLDGDLVGAEADAEAVIRGAPLRATRAFAVRGALLARRRDLARAEDDFSEAIQRLPGLAAAWLGRARVRTLQGRLERALVDLHRAVALAPHDPDARVERGYVLHSLGRSVLALDDLERAVELAPELPEARLYRSLALDAVGDPVRALADLERFVELAPSHPLAEASRRRIEAIRRGR